MNLSKDSFTSTKSMNCLRYAFTATCRCIDSSNNPKGTRCQYACARAASTPEGLGTLIERDKVRLSTLWFLHVLVFDG